MSTSVIKIAIIVASVSLFVPGGEIFAQKSRPDNFNKFIDDIRIAMPQEHSGVYKIPTENDFREWGTIVFLFRMQMFDSCRVLLRKYNYTLLQLKDSKSGKVYDIVREQSPVRFGWGTFIHNRNHSKRLNIEVNHPVDDDNILSISAELFRRTNAEWLLIAGGSRNALTGRGSTDVGRLKRTIFQRWHEMISDLTHITLCLHAYDEKSYPSPIRSADLIVSNGTTTDEQWGISQISLAFRDTLRSLGFACGLAMYDSGYARLSGGWNPQGVFSNDSLGFGHWLYLEVSHKLRSESSRYDQLVTSLDRALDITGKKISQQVNRAFGLVSPRVVRVDSLHRILFPPADLETYRIISFNARDARNDTIDVRMGNWLELLGSGKSVSSVTRLDTDEGETRHSRSPNSAETHSAVSAMNDANDAVLPSMIKFARVERSDSSAGDEDRTVAEPLQVHRIPLQPVLASTFEFASVSPAPVTFRWEGTISAQFNPNIQTFQISTQDQINEATAPRTMPKFLIPLINSSYRSANSKYVGIQMTEILVNEIARLVNEHQMKNKDIGLLAEQGERGDYYLRIFPSSAPKR